jgi:mRNA-degrading endonuclease YafQ of YafQ-DinJ toxin-antitoxin module
MLDLSYTTQFKRDLKLASKRGKKLKNLDDIVTLLREEKPLPAKNSNLESPPPKGGGFLLQGSL